MLTARAESDECELKVWQVEGVIHTPMLNGHCEKIEREHDMDDFSLISDVNVLTTQMHGQRNSIFLECLVQTVASGIL